MIIGFLTLAAWCWLCWQAWRTTPSRAEERKQRILKRLDSHRRRGIGFNPRDWRAPWAMHSLTLRYGPALR